MKYTQTFKIRSHPRYSLPDKYLCHVVTGQSKGQELREERMAERFEAGAESQTTVILD